MIPASYLSPATAQAILDTLDQGRGTTQGSNNTYSTNPSLTGGLITTQLRSRIESADLSTVTTISTAGLTTAEIDALNGMRSRIRDGIASVYEQYPKQNPLNDHDTGVPVLPADQDHRVDVLLQTIFAWDPRYFLRLRSDVGTDAVNSAYELPNRYQFLTNPAIIGTTRLHGFTSNVANVGPGTSRVTSTVPHGYYDGVSIQNMAVATATTWTANLNQADGDFASIDTYFAANATPTFVTGNDINISVASKAGDAYFWSAMNDLGAAHPEVTGINIRFYRDVARTDQIKASWGNIASVGWQGTDTPTERVAVNTDSQHLIIPTAPLQFDIISGNAASSVYELKYTAAYNPATQAFTSNVAGFSIYDGQLVNLATVGASTGYVNAINTDLPMYFKRVSETEFQVYRTADLAAGNVWAFGNTSTISNIAYSSGNTVWQVNFDSTVEYPELLSGQDIRFVNMSGAASFTAPVALTQNTGGGNIQITSGNVNLVYSAVGLRGDAIFADRMIAGTTGSMFYSDDGIDWFPATISPSSVSSNGGGPLRRIGLGPSGPRGYTAWCENTNPSIGPAFYIWTSDNGVNWNVQTGGYNYNFIPPTGDTWNGRDVFVVGTGTTGGWQLIQNASTGALRVATTTNSFAISTGVTVSQSDGAKCRIIATGNIVAVSTPTAIYYVASSSVSNPSAWIKYTANTIGPLEVSGTTISIMLEIGGAPGGLLYIDRDPITSQLRNRYRAYTSNSSFKPVNLLGFIDNRYIFSEYPDGSPTRGFYNEDLDSLPIFNNVSDRFTANAHPFTTGQQIRTSATFNYAGTVVTPPRDMWVQVIDANTIDLYENEERTVIFSSGRPAGAMTSSTITPVFYVKYRSARTWDLYLGSDVADTANRFSDNTKMTGGTTTGNTVWNGTATAVADNSGAFIRPMFYPQYHSPTRVSLWVDLGRTQPYAYFGRNGTRLNQQITYVTVGRYRLNNIAHRLAIGSDNVLPNTVVGINTTPVYYAKVINDFVIDLYADAALTTPFTQGTWANSAATLWQASPSTTAPYRLDNFYVPNIGTKTYFTTNLTTSTTTVNATWALTGSKFYTRYSATQTIQTAPNLQVAEHGFANAGPYFGQMRYAYTSGPGGPGNVAVVSGSTFGGFAGAPTPVYYFLNAPGRFTQNQTILFGIDAEPDSGTAPAVDEALAYTGEEWATVSNLTDRTLRRWPSTIAPVSMTWTIEQPNSTLETYNLTRYNRARDVTQYRMRLVYPPMTKVQVGEFTNVIHAAKGSFKPMVFTPPVNTVTQQYVTIKVGDKNSTVPAVFRARVDNASGVQVLQVDGLPPSLNLTDPAFDAGWAVELPIRNSTGSWGIPIHAVQTNAYGEANMRLNNNIASAIDFGAAIGADAADLDVFIDADSIELKVDTRGFHYLEVDLVTKRIF